jgi:predicted Zn-dependent peptidase
MIKYKKFTLDNGLKVLVHEDRSTPMVAMNILYDVGSKDEDQSTTGIAHLFEHLMFEGSVNIPSYDTPLQLAGGDNNAFTNNDITNYYLTLPAANIETGFWLESDRMLGLDFSQTNLDTQKKVVIEEFKQRYLNQPYGDATLLLRPMAYKIHPYRWPTIGMDISHIEKIDLDYIRNFFYSHYAPNNAILSLSGNISYESVSELASKWFGPIGRREIKPRNLPDEPGQTNERRLTVERDVPAHALYKVWHIGKRTDPDFFSLDLITDLLAGGESGRLNNHLVRDKKMFSDVNVYITSDIDPGLMILSGRLMKGVGIQEAEEEVNRVLNILKENYPEKDELEKVKNKYESNVVFSYTNILNKAMNLALYELLGDPELINREVETFRKTDEKMVVETARKYFTDSNCSTMYYKSTAR